VLIVRLKQCQTALADGRLDEAFELVCQPDVRGHRRGQKLVGRVVESLLDRGRRHLAAGNLVAAGQDCEKAGRLGGNLPEIAQLRTATSNAISEQRRVGQLRNEALAAARRHADRGQITLGEQLLASCPADSTTIEPLKQELAARRASIQAIRAKAATVLDAGDWEAAIEHLIRLDPASRCEPDVRELSGRINAKVTVQAAQAIEAGRLDVAGSLLSRLQKLPGQWADADHLRRTLAQCREAFDCIARSDAAGAERIVRTLAPLWPRAAWLEEVAQQVRQIREAAESIRTGPLGLGVSAPHAAAAHAPVAHVSPRPNASASSSIDCILHVDGVGGFRVIGRPVVSIGPVSSSHPVDLPLMIDASLPVISIMRSDDDYFLQCRRNVLVNDKSVAGKLLANGDRIALGPRCRITFRRPSPASNSAILDLSGTKLPQADVRHVILLDRELIVGPGSAVHIRADDLAAPAVVLRRDDALVCRANGTSTELAPGIHVPIGPIGLVVAKQGVGV